MVRAPDLLRDACAAGYYCPAKTPYPLACPGGTYSPSTGQSFLSDCLTTPKGFYSIAASIQPNAMCSPGYYCPAKSTGPNEVILYTCMYNLYIYIYTFIYMYMYIHVSLYTYINTHKCI
jgi:hypothetical protein